MRTLSNRTVIALVFGVSLATSSNLVLASKGTIEVLEAVDIAVNGNCEIIRTVVEVQAKGGQVFLRTQVSDTVPSTRAYITTLRPVDSHSLEPLITELLYVGEHLPSPDLKVEFSLIKIKKVGTERLLYSASQIVTCNDPS